MIRSPRTRAPFWQVTAVSDPEGRGGDFAYTVGLAAHGLPELHLWARPSLGDDPGEDWRFSGRDLGGILNESAWRLLEDDLRIGDAWSEEYDAGLATVRFQLDPPQKAASLEAYGAGDSPVAPIRWSLERPPLGPSTPMTEEACRAAEGDLRWLRETIDGLDRARAAPAIWEPGQHFGPRTPVVEAFAQVIESLEGDRLDALVCRLIDLHRAQVVSGPLVVARSAARPVGRGEAVRNAEARGEQIGRRFGGDWGVESAEAVLARFGAVGRRDHAEALGHLRPLIAVGLAAFLATVVVADQLGPEQRLAGLGPALGAFVAPGVAPHPDWWAPGEVRDRLRLLLDRCEPAQLVRAAASWRAVSHETADDWVLVLRVRTMTSAAMAPDISSLLPAGTAATIRLLCGVNQLPWSLVQEWARDLCAVLTLADALPAPVRQAFADASLPWLPHLGPLMDR